LAYETEQDHDKFHVHMERDDVYIVEGGTAAPEMTGLLLKGDVMAINLKGLQSIIPSFSGFQLIISEIDEVTKKQSGSHEVTIFTQRLIKLSID